MIDRLHWSANEQNEKSLGRLPSSEAPGKPFGLLVWIRFSASETNMFQPHSLRFRGEALSNLSPAGFEVLDKLFFTDPNSWAAVMRQTLRLDELIDRPDRTIKTFGDLADFQHGRSPSLLSRSVRIGTSGLPKNVCGKGSRSDRL